MFYGFVKRITWKEKIVNPIRKKKEEANKGVKSAYLNAIKKVEKNAETAREIVDNFDPEQYQSIIDFATAANGGRNINTQTVTTQPSPQTPP